MHKSFLHGVVITYYESVVAILESGTRISSDYSVK